jgi:hypothetical protein
MEPIASSKVKTMEGEGVGARSLIFNTSGVEGHVGAPGWDYKEWQANQSLTWTCTNQTTNWLVYNQNIFGARTNHRQTQTHKIHHGPDLGEATTFPLIVYDVPDHGTSTQMSFFLKTPKWESRNSQNWDFCDFEGP